MSDSDRLDEQFESAPSSEPEAHPSDRFRGDLSGEIVVVGPCASGKSTLAARLIELGYRARVVGQEHSEIGRLWRRHDPALVIGLQASLATVRSRRGREWSAAVYERQQRRLEPAMAAATVVLDTGELSAMATLAAAVAAIREAGIHPVRGPAAK